ncbi:hypothetical protein ACWFNQ_05835, partial [Bacillus altitudinis]
DNLAILGIVAAVNRFGGWFFNFDHLIKPSFKTSKPRIESYEIPSEIPHCLVPYVLRQRVVYSSHK